MEGPIIEIEYRISLGILWDVMGTNIFKILGRQMRILNFYTVIHVI